MSANFASFALILALETFGPSVRESGSLETAGKSSQPSLSCYEARQFRKSALPPPQADIADPNKHVRYGRQPESAIEPDLTLALAKPRFR